MPIRDTYCSYCGTKYPEPLTYPRTCPSCKTMVWANPIPVAVMIVPVIDGARTGVLVIRRAIPPQIGKLALVGGFVEEHETWQHGGAREVREESNVAIDAAGIEPFWFASSDPRPNRVLLFGTAPAIRIEDLPPFAPDHETSERGVVFGPDGLDEAFAFPTHIEAARRWFARAGTTGPHAFLPR